MRRLLLTLLLMLTLFTPTRVFAEEHSWTADPPKQTGMAVLWCTATATKDGDTYTMTNYAPLDDGWDAERYAQRVFRDDVVRGMLYAFPGRPHTIDASDVTVSCTGQR